ncbi:MAG: hypothetical protein V1870_05445, partial [Candidatus Aenigmatarchaeota archaeon]
NIENENTNLLTGDVTGDYITGMEVPVTIGSPAPTQQTPAPTPPAATPPVTTQPAVNKNAASSNANTNTQANDNKQLIVQLSEMLVRKENMMKAARAGYGQYSRTWKTAPGLDVTLRCGSSDPLLRGYNYATAAQTSSGNVPTITVSATAGVRENVYDTVNSLAEQSMADSQDNSKSGMITGQATGSGLITGQATGTTSVFDYGTGAMIPAGGSANMGVNAIEFLAGDYHTEGGEVSKVNRTVYISIVNSTNSTPMDCVINNVTNQSCRDMAVNTDENGYFKFFYRPMVNDTYNISVAVNTNGGAADDKSSGLIIEKKAVFKVSPFSAPEIYFLKNESCTLPAPIFNFTPANVDLAKFPIVIKNPINITVPYVNYEFRIVDEPDSKYGDAGFEYYNNSGDLVLVNNISYNLRPGETIIVNVSSGMILPSSTDIRTYYITVNVSNTTYNVSKEFQFNHTVFLKSPAILNTITEPSLRPFDIRPETYFLRITSSMPTFCGYNDYKLLKEVPRLWSGAVEIDGETDTVRLNSTESAEARFILSPNPNEIEIGKRYESTLIVTETLPTEIGSLKGSGDLLGIDVDPRILYLVTDSRVIFVNKTDYKVTSYEANGGLSIAADIGPGGNIYWSEYADEGRILCSSKIRFSANRIVNDIGPAKIAATYNYLYLTQEDGIYRVVKNCIAEQRPDKIYSVTNASIIDISADRDIIYWLETNGTKTEIKSVGETQISSSGAVDVYTLAERDANLLYILKGSGRIGDAGRFGVFYARDSRIAKLGSQRDYIVIGGEGNEKIVSDPVDMALDNDTIFWIQNGVHKISKDNLANYISMYYEYTPDAPLITINPMTAILSLEEAKEFRVNITNKAFVDVDYQIFLEGLTNKWYTDMGIIETKFGPKETKSYSFILQPDRTVDENQTYSICIRAKNTKIWPNSDTASLFSRCINVDVGKRTSPQITLSIIDAMRTENNKAVTLPERAVWYDVLVKNMDRSDFSASIFDLVATVPARWVKSFETTMLNIMPQETKKTKLKITPSKEADDGEYEIAVNAINEIDDTAKSTTKINIIIDLCGNGICNLERGEDNDRCAIDCPNPAYNNFAGVYNVPKWPNLLQHDYNTSNGVNFSTRIGLSLDRSLQQQRVLFCRQTASPQECKLSDCGLGKPCLAAKSLQPEESIPLMSMRCPSDSTEAYYILYTGRSVNSGERDYISPNYTYSCPFYNTTALLTIKASMEEKSTLCQQVLFNYNNSVFRPPAGRTRENCVDAWTKICSIEDNFLKYLNLVLDPNVISIEKTGYTFELYSKLKNQGWFTDNSQCEGVITLFIEDVNFR